MITNEIFEYYRKKEKKIKKCKAYLVKNNYIVLEKNNKNEQHNTK
jgi:hypothetical protein